MRPVEHRPGRQGNPDASLYLRRPPAAQPQTGCSAPGSGAACANASTVLRGSSGHVGCIDSVGRPGPRPDGAPRPNSFVSSSADRDHSADTGAPAQSTPHTQASWPNPPCTPRAQAQGAGRNRPSAPHCVQHRLHRHGVGRGAVNRLQAMDRVAPDSLRHRRALYRVRRTTRHRAMRMTARRIRAWPSAAHPKHSASRDRT